MNRSGMALQENEPAHIPGRLAPFCCDYVASALRSRQGVQNIVRIFCYFQSDQGFGAINLISLYDRFDLRLFPCAQFVPYRFIESKTVSS
jgi:hypothetical protein